jgi:uncharacterized protein YggU (UPF0235/DUF167 family)
LILHVRLTPKGGADRVDGWSLDPEGRPVLSARVRAAPVEGEANAALEQLLAKALGVRRSTVRVARGGQSRLKAVEIEGVDETQVAAAFGEPPARDVAPAFRRPPRHPGHSPG